MTELLLSVTDRRALPRALGSLAGREGRVKKPRCFRAAGQGGRRRHHPSGRPPFRQEELLPQAEGRP